MQRKTKVNNLNRLGVLALTGCLVAPALAAPEPDAWQAKRGNAAVTLARGNADHARQAYGTLFKELPKESRAAQAKKMVAELAGSPDKQRGVEVFRAVMADLDEELSIGEYHREFGKQLSKAGRGPEALQILDEYVARFPKGRGAPLTRIRAGELLMREDPDEAIARFKHNIDTLPRGMSMRRVAKLYTAKTLRKQGRQEEAARAYVEAVLEAPSSVEARMAITNLKVLEKRLGKETMDQILPKDMRAFMAVMRSTLNATVLSTRIEEFIAKRPDSELADDALAESIRRTHRRRKYEKTKEMTGRFKSTYPKSHLFEEMSYLGAKTLHDEKRFKEAIAAFRNHEKEFKVGGEYVANAKFYRGVCMQTEERLEKIRNRSAKPKKEQQPKGTATSPEAQAGQPVEEDAEALIRAGLDSQDPSVSTRAHRLVRSMDKG
jgi:TolA-binding protein